MFQRDYVFARNCSWLTLLKAEINQLPVSVCKIARSYDISIKPYKNKVMAFVNKGSWTILYDKEQSVQQIRFSIAHEIGHIVMGHYRLPQNPVIERQADVFALRILAPACVLWGLGIETPEDISRMCNISLQVAKIRADRLRILKNRDRFFNDPLERQVFDQFRDFIAQNKK